MRTNNMKTKQYTNRNSESHVAEKNWKKKGRLFLWQREFGHSPTYCWLPWFPNKSVVSMCIDPTGSWLLNLCSDNYLYVLCVRTILEPGAKVDQLWRVDDVTQICQVPSTTGLVSCIKWWKSMCGDNIVILATKVGFLVFIDVVSQSVLLQVDLNEYIVDIQLLHSDSFTETYLLVSTKTNNQFRLLLDEKLEIDFSVIQDSAYFPIQNQYRTIYSQAKNADETAEIFKPRRIFQFPSHVQLSPQQARGRCFIAAHDLKSSVYKIYGSGLDQGVLFMYKIPVDVDNILYTDKLMFASTFIDGASLQVLANQFTEVSGDEIQDFPLNGSVQTFDLEPEERILCLYKKSFPHYWHEKQQGIPSGQKRKKQSNNTGLAQENSKGLSEGGLESEDDTRYQSHSVFDGCIVVTSKAVYECKPRISPERLFVTLCENNCPVSRLETLDILVGVDMSYLAIQVAEQKLKTKEYGYADKLLTLAKCSNMQRCLLYSKYELLDRAIKLGQELLHSGESVSSTDRKSVLDVCVKACVLKMLTSLDSKHSDVLRDVLLSQTDILDTDIWGYLQRNNLHDVMWSVARSCGQVQQVVDLYIHNRSLTLNSSITANQDIANNKWVKKHKGFLLDHLTGDDLINLLHTNSTIWTQLLDLIEEELPQFDFEELRLVSPILNPAQTTISQYLDNILKQREILCSSPVWDKAVDLMMLFVLTQLHQSNNPDKMSGTLDMGDMPSPGKPRELVVKETTSPQKISCVLWQESSTIPINIGDEIELKDVTVRYNTFSKQNQLSANRVDEVKGTSLKGDMISKKEVLQCSGNLQACSTHITAVIVDKKLFVWGRFGGINTLDVLQDCKCCEIPLPSNTVAMSVSCGYTHILVLTNQGVCSLGSNKYGELGLGNTKSSQVPRVISRLKDERIVQVDCGHYHNLALSEHGRVYTWGWGAYGQLGQGHIDDMNIPTEVTALKCEFVVSVSAGHAHSMVLTRQGVVCVFGNNAFGQLGLGGCMKRSTPTKLQLNAPVSSISTQYFHCVAVTDKEEIYEWGVSPVGLKQKITVAKKKKSGKGTKTEPSDRADHLTPKMVNRGSLGLDVQIVQVSCGVDFSMALTSSGKVYGWGRNLDGQLGIGKRHTKTETRLAPVVQMNSLSIQQLACGPDFVVAMDTQGETWGWGRNDYGQLSLLMTDPTGMLSQSFVFPVQISTVPSAKPPAQGNQWDVIPLSIDRANLHKLADYNNQMEGQVLPLHAYLQCLSPFINLHLVLCKAIQLENYPCAAQICDLNQRYGDAFMYRLKGLNSANTLLKEQVCHIISECLGKLKGSKRKLDIYHTVLQQLFDWWATQRECLSVADLENILTPYLLDLAVIIFTIISRMELTGSNTIRFSPPFTMQMTNYILTKLKHGHNNQIINKLKNEALSSTASNPWKPSFGGEKIWWEIVENRKDSKAVELSGKVIKQIQCDMNFETTVKSGELIDEIVNDDSDVEAKEDVESGKLNQHFEPVEPENWKNKDKLIFDYTEGFDNQGDIISGQLESPTSREKTNAKQIFISSLDNDDTVNEGCSDSSSVQNKYEQYPEMKDSAILDSEDLIPEVLSTSLNSKKEDKSIEAVIVFSCGHTLTKSVFTLDIEKHSENRDIMFSYYTRTGVNTLVCPQCLLCAIETVI